MAVLYEAWPAAVLSRLFANPLSTALLGPLCTLPVQSRMCDAPTFVRQLEGVYAQLWQRWVRQQLERQQGQAAEPAQEPAEQPAEQQAQEAATQ